MAFRNLPRRLPDGVVEQEDQHPRCFLPMRQAHSLATGARLSG